MSNTDSTTIFLITIPIILILLAIAILRLISWKKIDEQKKQTSYLLIYFVFTPVLLAFVLSWILPYSIWGTRHLIIVFAPLAILAAFLFSKSGTKTPLQALSLGLIFLLFGAAFALQLTRKEPKYIWCAWENLAQNLDKSKFNQNGTTKIYTFEDLVAYHFWFALKINPKSRFQIVKVSGIKGLTEDKAYFLPRGFDEIVLSDDFEDDEKFFVAFRDQKWNEAKPPLKNLIERGYKVSAPKAFEAQGLKAFLVEVQK